MLKASKYEASHKMCIRDRIGKDKLFEFERPGQIIKLPHFNFLFRTLEFKKFIFTYLYKTGIDKLFEFERPEQDVYKRQPLTPCVQSRCSSQLS